MCSGVYLTQQINKHYNKYPIAARIIYITAKEPGNIPSNVYV
jgi:hypothetical protein